MPDILPIVGTPDDNEYEFEFEVTDEQMAVDPALVEEMRKDATYAWRQVFLNNAMRNSTIYGVDDAEVPDAEVA